MATTTAESIRVGSENGGSGKTSGSLRLVVLHGKRTYNITDLDPQATTVGDLRNKIFEVSSVPPALQKLIVKGKGLLSKDEQTLAQVGFKSKGKVTLIGNPLEKVVGATTGVDLNPNKRDEAQKKKKKSDEDERPKRWSETKVHEKVIKKGVPIDAEAGLKDKNHALPKSIKGILDSRGEPVRLTFRNEIQELWIASKDKTEKMPYLQVRDVASDPIHTDESYHIVALQVGPTPSDLRYFYYVPAQYVRSLKYTLLSTGAGAGLISMLSDTVE